MIAIQPVHWRADCCLARTTQKTPISVETRILRYCLATNCNIRYNNGLPRLPTVVMQYQGKVFTKLLPSNALIKSVTTHSTMVTGSLHKTLYTSTDVCRY
jgi:hypothetical protein